jgi:predicted ATP-grasp superfamily ATP-dependent carboligase
MVEKITPELDTYDQLVAAAEQVLVFTTDQTKESRLFKRTEKALTVENCTDCKEATALLSFLATKAGFNCLVDVEFSYDKRRDGSYKIIKWSGSGIPTHADLKKYNR